MNAHLPTLANLESLQGFRWTNRAQAPCAECGGSGIRYRDNGPSGLCDPCDECAGDGWVFSEGDLS